MTLPAAARPRHARSLLTRPSNAPLVAADIPESEVTARDVLIWPTDLEATPRRRPSAA